MAHFAKLDENNIVIEVHTLNIEEEQAGIDFLTDLYGGGWWKKSFKDGSSRKNHASVGFSYDKAIFAFITPQLFGFL